MNLFWDASRILLLRNVLEAHNLAMRIWPMTCGGHPIVIVLCARQTSVISIQLPQGGGGRSLGGNPNRESGIVCTRQPVLPQTALPKATKHISRPNVAP